jgi:hypothetical protein
VARKALAGFVDKEVGSATHYHADYVAPSWAPTLVKLKQVGAHIFYRWTGPWGEPGAFTGRYLGGESNLSPALLSSLDARTQGVIDPEAQKIPPGRTFTLAVGGEVRTYRVADPEAPAPQPKDGARTRVEGVLSPVRRKPTPEEVQAINASLARMEQGEVAAKPKD